MPGVIKFTMNATGTMLYTHDDEDASGIVGREITDDWGKIRENSDNGTSSSVYKVGDFKKLVLDGPVGGYTFVQYPCYCIIIGINHNADLEGNNRIHFCIGYSSGETINKFISLCHTNYNSYYSSSTGGFCMNTTNTSVGGWESSYMRNTLCVDFISCLPTELQAVLKTVTKYTDNGSYNVGNITATTDTIFLLGGYEAAGAYLPANEQYYQKKYEYFEISSKKIYNNLLLNDTCRSWCRSPMRTIDRYYDQCFCTFNDYMNSGSYNYANASMGIIPCFCV